MTTPYIAQNPVDDFGQRFSTDKFSATLATSTDTTLTISSTQREYKMVMKPSTDAVVYVSLNETAEVPAGASFASTTSEMLNINGKTCREVKQGDVIHFITDGTGVEVSVQLYSIGLKIGI